MTNVRRQGKNKALWWLGEQRNPVKIDRSSDLVMDSVFNYYNDEEPSLRYKFGKLFLDNGAFTASMKGVALNVERVIFVQESLRPDKTIPLDYPLKPGMTVSVMARFWKRTRENILFWQGSTSLRKKLVPALHAWNKDTLAKNVRWLQRNVDANYIAFGSLVNPEFSDYTGFFGDRQPRKELVDMLSYAFSVVEKNSSFKVHLMGFGSSPLMLHLGYYLGARSTDSAGYRRKAAYGKIILPGTGERYLGETSSNFGRTSGLDEDDPKSSRDLALLNRCTCPVCMVNKYQLWADWKARAIHNEHVMKQEAKIAERFLSMEIEVYEKYLDNIFSRSSLKYLWEYAKLRKKYYRISDVLFEEAI